MEQETPKPKDHAATEEAALREAAFNALRNQQRSAEEARGSRPYTVSSTVSRASRAPGGHRKM